MRRRDFLSLCGSAGLGFAAPVGLPSFAAEATRAEPRPYEGPFYVVFNASGGWDTTYLMDPKGVNGINRLYKEGDILVRQHARFTFIVSVDESPLILHHHSSLVPNAEPAE